MADFTERLFKTVQAHYPVRKRLVAEKTPFQNMQIFETEGFGRMLVLDDIVETTEADEFVYHEMMTHVPMYTHPNPTRVLIIGGGDGGCLREVLRHPVERAVMVEIDEAVVRASKRYLRKICRNAFDDPRAELIIGDGAAYVRDTAEKFDAVIVDSTDPLGPSMPLFGPEFYRNVVRILRRNGLVVRQCGSAFMQGRAELTAAVRHARKVFSCVKVFVTAVPTYVIGHFTHPMLSMEDFSKRITLGAVRRRFARHPLEMKYYSPDVHAAAFALPEYVRRLCARA